MLKIKKLFLALTIVLISASPVWAENWVRVATKANLFVDTDSIRKASGFVYYWQITNYLEPLHGDLSSKIYIKLNCDSLGYMYLKIETYDSHMGKGKLTSSFTPQPKWDYFASGSPGDIIAKQVCKWAK